MKCGSGLVLTAEREEHRQTGAHLSSTGASGDLRTADYLKRELVDLAVGCLQVIISLSA